MFWGKYPKINKVIIKKEFFVQINFFKPPPEQR